METETDKLEKIINKSEKQKQNLNLIEKNDGTKSKEFPRTKENNSEKERLEEEEEQEQFLEAEGEDEAVEEEEVFGAASTKPRKFAFKLKRNESGNILTVHHTVRELGKFLRIRLGVGCFSERGTQFVAIDKRGNVFVFDLAAKRHWRLALVVLKASALRGSLQHASEYFAGTKLGHLLQLDVEKDIIVRALSLSSDAVSEISFPGQATTPSASRMLLVRTGHQAVLVNLDNFTATHRLDFDAVRISLKFACYLPLSEHIFTCFTNDAVHVWSALTLNTLRVAHPIKARDRRMQLTAASADAQSIPEFLLTTTAAADDDDGGGKGASCEFVLHCQDQDFSNGRIVAYCCAPDNSSLCLSTLDSTLLLLSPYTFELQHIFRLRDFMVKACAFLAQPKETLLLCLASSGGGGGQVVLLDCQRTEFKMIVTTAASVAVGLSLSGDGKLLAVFMESGEADIYATCRLYNTLKTQEQCMQLLKAACKQPKPVALGCGVGKIDKAESPTIAEDFLSTACIQKLLKRDRLLSILREYGCYPAKYRQLIWCALLRLPTNRREFQQLLRLDTPPPVKKRAAVMRLRQESLKRALVKLWSCLAHWCKLFGHCDFVPYLIFPFVKLFPRNALVCFEICATLLTNHFQLWFEFHPLPPANYLGLCANLLLRCDPALCKFYASLKVDPLQFAWPLLSTAFSEVLDEPQWLCLWDNIVSQPPHFLVFCVVAYNMLQREVILRLPDSATVAHFFREQNAIDVCKLIARSYRLQQNCPATLQPQRYMREFQPIPKGVYPKFLRYPQEWLAQHEAAENVLQQEQRAIDTRIRELELEELKMVERLEQGLRSEEHAKRIKEMEKLYQETLKREEARLACQRKMLLLYQKEIRTRKGQVLTTLQAAERRKEACEKETELDTLMHSIERDRLRDDTNLILAEDEIRNRDVELLTQKYLDDANGQSQPLAQKFRDDMQRLRRERSLLQVNLGAVGGIGGSVAAPGGFGKSVTQRKHVNLEEIEQKIDEIQREFVSLTAGN